MQCVHQPCTGPRACQQRRTETRAPTVLPCAMHSVLEPPPAQRVAACSHGLPAPAHHLPPAHGLCRRHQLSLCHQVVPELQDHPRCILLWVSDQKVCRMGWKLTMRKCHLPAGGTEATAAAATALRSQQFMQGPPRRLTHRRRGRQTSAARRRPARSASRRAHSPPPGRCAQHPASPAPPLQLQGGRERGGH